MRQERTTSDSVVGKRRLPRFSAMILISGATFLWTCTAQAQQTAGSERSRERATGYGGASGQKETKRPAWRGDDIVADNLDRVAATADQILEMVNKDAGLMVELKGVIAREAGESGQILEESDLSDTALAARLREDLRTRVLATRLLRRYGYLLPKVNPDSDMAQEQRLVFQERAQELARFAERNYEPRARAREEFQTSCGPQLQSDCENAGRSIERTRARLSPSDGDTVPAEPFPGREEYGPPSARPEKLNAPDEFRTTADVGSSFEAPLASSRRGNSSAFDSTPTRGAGGMAEGGVLATELPANEAQGMAGLGAARAGNFGAPRSSAREGAPRNTERETAESTFAELEPVHMVHRPNPYADTPSLFDLYVQASATPGRIERFGMNVFRRGAVNPDVLPMDLPVGPDYVLGPGDSLSIDLWGGVSQRLFRTVDREGKLQLPEAGPLLVSGRSLGEAQESVQRALRTQFRDISADVSLLKLRTVRVYVVGEVVSPGAYDVSSLSTPLNALFQAGGITASGSLRRLEHYRLAGGILPAAALRHIEVQRLDAHEKRTMLSLEIGEASDKETLSAAFEKFNVQDGDEIHIFPIAPYNSRAVYLEGHVLRPGRYSYREGMKLTDLIGSYGDLLPEPSERYAEIIRIVGPENRPVVESFSLGTALAHPENAPKLEPRPSASARCDL